MGVSAGVRYPDHSEEILRTAKIKLERVRWAVSWTADSETFDFGRRAAAQLTATVGTWPETAAILTLPAGARDWAVRDLVLPFISRLVRRLRHPRWGLRPAAWLAEAAWRAVIRRWPVRMKEYHAGALLNIRDLGIPDHVLAPGYAVVFLQPDGGLC